jgi:hypothetical protein
MENSSTKSCSACGSWWRLPLLLGLVLAAIVLSRGAGFWDAAPQKRDNVASGSADAARERVSLRIDFGNGRQRDFDSLAWHEGMTVAELMGKAPGIEVMQRGSGQGAFLTAVDGVANEGTEGSNWTYEVNGVGADRSFAVYELAPNDRVLWRFGPQR